MARALEGGESDLISSHHVFNVLQEQRPDVVETLSKPIWYFDRKGETSKGQKEWIRGSVFYWFDGRVYTKYMFLSPLFFLPIDRQLMAE